METGSQPEEMLIPPGEVLRLKRLMKLTVKYGRDTVDALVNYCIGGSPSVAEIAVASGVSATQVYRWIKDVKAGEHKGCGPIVLEAGERAKLKDARKYVRSERKLKSIRSRHGDEVADAVANFRGGKHSLSSIGRMAGVSREAVRQWVQVALCVESTRDLPDLDRKDRLERHRAAFPVLGALLDWGVKVKRREVSKKTFETGEGVRFCVREHGAKDIGDEGIIRFDVGSVMDVDFYVVQCGGVSYVIPFDVLGGVAGNVYLHREDAKKFAGRFDLLVKADHVAASKTK